MSSKSKKEQAQPLVGMGLRFAVGNTNKLKKLKEIVTSLGATVGRWNSWNHGNLIIFDEGTEEQWKQAEVAGMPIVSAAWVYAYVILSICLS